MENKILLYEKKNVNNLLKFMIIKQYIMITLNPNLSQKENIFQI